jgi:hypothetical protein
MKNIVLTLGFLASACGLFGQITITQFNSAPAAEALTWTENTTTAAGIFSVTGGDATGAVFYDISSLNLLGTQLNDVEVTARIDSGNLASGFTVNFYDNNLDGLLTATFSATSFNTGGFTAAIASLSIHPSAFVISVPVAYMQIAGNGSTQAFRFSFDQIVANATVIPEPSTYAAIIGLLALGYVAYRRRQLAA